MFVVRLRDCKEASARPKRDRPRDLVAATSGEAVVERGEPCIRDPAVSSRNRLERRVEVGAETEWRDNLAKPDDLGPDRQGREKLRALHRLGLVGHDSEPAEYSASPIVGRLASPGRCEAAQIT